jgi:chromosome segregation protein
MQIERLRLAGFKSFADPTELVIAPGLTGIVGPNGCGKSNLVEALRWVMGEASARRLRGGEMDDVIFGGAGNRPARNLAEVSVILDNCERGASSMVGDQATIEIVRRIVRDAGSTYRINGREARARDVQLLFADAMSGPHSSAIVGQGRIGALIAATPRERRGLLDEAAGTIGLYARRHEAELRLRAAENNLARLDDVVATLAAQIETLRRQARQAQRYRRLGQQIQETEVRLFDIKWRHALGEAERLMLALRDAERDLEAAGEAACIAERTREAAEAAVPPARLRQAGAAAEIQRLRHTGEALDRELVQMTEARAEAERRLAQIASDHDREAERLADAAAALTALIEERAALASAGADAETERRAAAARAETAAGDRAAAETRLQRATEAAAVAKAHHDMLEKQNRDLLQRRDRLASRLADAERQRAALLAAIVPAEVRAAAHASVARAGADADAARCAFASATDRLSAAKLRETAALARALDAERGLASLEAEATALRRVLAPIEPSGPGGPPLIAQLRVKVGFEAAIAALFGNDLAAPLLSEPGAASGPGWVALTAWEPDPLPEGAHPLAEVVEAPAVLARGLTRAGWVACAADGWRLQSRLGPGQSLVDRDGRLWRWDGFVRIGPAANAAIEHLRHRNRLDQLESEIVMARVQALQASGEAARCRADRESGAATEHAAVTQMRRAEEALARASRAAAELLHRHIEAEAKLTALAEAIGRIGTEHAGLTRQISDVESALARQPGVAAARAALDKARAEADEARRREAAAGAQLDGIIHATEERRRRLAAIAAEMEAWNRRQQESAAQQAVLTERYAEAAAEIARLDRRLPAIAVERRRLAASAAIAQAACSRAEQALTAAEATLQQAIQTARRAEAAVGAGRERRAEIRARHDAARERLDRLNAEIDEHLGIDACDLGAFAAAVTVEPYDEGTAEDLADRLDQLTRERDAIGPVNLLAATQLVEVEKQRADLERERADVTTAIARLRRGIAALDQEGRNRLSAAFAALNAHFSSLFTRLFGGGRAELVWIGDADPLDAGLDILASPPGKRLASLSLLSGGEQALTALALIFAMFLTRPAPICVLDEVDAPLDDANVERFCGLLSDISETTGTRFLVVTHHRVTMAHMDRLFGITMAERGVSQLVSVALARATMLRQTA